MLLYQKLQRLQIGDGLIATIFAQMQVEFSAAAVEDLAQAEWLSDWKRWEVFANDVQQELARAPPNVLPEVYLEETKGLISSLYFDVWQRIALDKEQTQELAANLRARTDEARILVLQQECFQHFQASGADCNCLTDSLLQLLDIHGLATAPYNQMDACENVRQILLSTHGSEPRNYMTGKVEPRAYLEHYRHAPLVILSIIHSHGSTERNSALGFRVVVRVRYDRMVGADNQLLVRDPVSEKVDWEVRLQFFAEQDWVLMGTVTSHWCGEELDTAR